MKKFSLLLCCFVALLVSQKVWADGEVAIETLSSSSPQITKSSDGVLTITSNHAGDLKSFMDNTSGNSTEIASMQSCTSLVLVGTFNSNDLDAVKLSGENFAFKVVNMKYATFASSNQGSVTYYMWSTQPTNPIADRVYVIGGSLYEGKKGSEHFIDVVDASASNSFSGTADNVWDKDYLTELANVEGYKKIRKDEYYQKINGNWEHILKEEIPSEETIGYLGNDYTNDVVNGTLENNGGEYQYICVHSSTEYSYYYAHYNFSWESKDSYSDDTSVSNHYNNLTDAPAPTSEYDKIAVGGTVKKYTNNAWQLYSSSVWTVMLFEYWGSNPDGGSIETAILPDGIEIGDLDHNDIFKYCTKITRVESGNTIATITRDGSNNIPAVLNVPSNSTEFTRMKNILEQTHLVSEGLVSSSIGESGYNPDTHKYTAQEELNVEDINAAADVRVLDLKNLSASDITAANLKLLNNNIEYIILPGSMDKTFVCDDTNYDTSTGHLPLLKAVISAQSTTLVAHVVVAGHLAQARCYATGLKENHEGQPAVMGLTTVTLSGNLNADDISTHDQDKGLSGENSTITTMDLEKAYFANYNHMAFQAAGFQGQSNECVLSNITLPTTMNHIPQDCFRNMKSLEKLCIPYNYEYIHNGALYDTNVEHLTTTDKWGNEVDNKKYSYTLSANLKQLGDTPSPLYNNEGVPNGVETYVFPKENGVTEIYSLATLVPICYKNVFSYDLTFGYGGQDNTKVYCRDRYFNNGERNKSFVVLRYPSKEVYDGRPDNEKETSYELMKKKYTDVTKVYTKKDQTGAVDANGNPILWPMRTEGNRVYNQATVGALWDDWTKTYTGWENSEIGDGEDRVVNNNNNNNNNPSRRFDGESPTIREIDLSLGASTGVLTDPYTFTPTEDFQNMFQYIDMPVTYDDVTYDKIVINFDGTVPEGFYVHTFGANDLDHSTHLAGLQTITIDNLTTSLETNNVEKIPDFTIFNSWGVRSPITIREAYFATSDDSKKLNISFTNGTSTGVTKVRGGNSEYFTFTPTANVKNMFQYLNMPVTYNDVNYNKVVVEFADNEEVPAGFFIHGYGVRDNYFSLKGKTGTYELQLNDGNIDDFTIFNWDDAYWTESGFKNSADAANPRQIKIKRAYFTTDTYTPSETAKYHGDLTNYLGWHQIVLTQAAYVETKEEVKKDEKIVRNYVDAGWFTFCIPFDLTYSEVVEMMGIPASNDKTDNYLGATISNVGGVDTYSGGSKKEADVLPDIRQLLEVERNPGTSVNNIIYRMSLNLYNDDTKNYKTAYYYDFVDETKGSGIVCTPKLRFASNQSNMTPSTPGENDDPVFLLGGRPYLIHAYIRDNELATLQNAYNYNLGKFILTRYADKFNESASCIHDDGSYEQMDIFEGTKNSASVRQNGEKTMRFAKPYENHKVQAVKNVSGGMQSLEYEENGRHYRYYYTMVGQFWEQDLPLYCVYYSPKKNQWYRYTNSDFGFKWEPYKCVIMATPEVINNDSFVAELKSEYNYTTETATTAANNAINTCMGITGVTAEQAAEDQASGKERFTALSDSYTFNHFGGGFRDISKCHFPMNYVGTYDWIPSPLKLWFSGRNDYSFNHDTTASTRFIVTLDDNEDIVDYGDNATAVKTIETLDGVPQFNSNTRVYNMSGQYLGNSTDGLPKGVYIVGGRKIVIER